LPGASGWTSRRRHRIARIEAQGLDDVSLCFFGATDQVFTKADVSYFPAQNSLFFGGGAANGKKPSPPSWLGGLESDFG
jgi:hypothetical protein